MFENEIDKKFENEIDKKLENEIDKLIKEKKTNTSISIKDIFVLDNTNKNNYIKLTSHIYYQSLKQHNPIIYSDYIVKAQDQLIKETGTWEGFFNLYKKIKKTGFDFKNNDSIVIKKINDIWVCSHGRHRICMLRKIYGKDTNIKLKNNRVFSIVV
jgi:hypothetical protein